LKKSDLDVINNSTYDNNAWMDTILPDLAPWLQFIYSNFLSLHKFPTHSRRN